MKQKQLSTKALFIYLLLFILAIVALLPADIIKEPSVVGEVLGIVRILGTNAPYFDPPLTNFSVNQTDPFFFDVNCSDVDALDPSLYYSNATIFEIDNVTGIINESRFDQDEIGNFSIMFWCVDTFGFNTTTTINFEVIDQNEAPILTPIGPQIAIEGELYELDVEATDADGDNLTFGATTTLFTIDPVTGVVSFTPTTAQIGNYTINFTVFDGLEYDYEIVSFRIILGPFCGDGTCGASENCETCSQDCGVCPSLPGEESGAGEETQAEGSGAQSSSSSSGAATAASTEASTAPLFQCQENWECSDWGVCTIDGIRTRTCIDKNRCNTEREKPALVEQCEYQPTCFDGIQNGGETGIDCGGFCEPCIVASCFDGIQNQGEEGIDCGGPCLACTQAEIEKAPFLEIPGVIKLPRIFPWLLLLIIAIILIATIIYDQWRMRKMRKLPLDDFKEEIHKYRPIRRKIFTFDLNMTLITIIALFYIYLYSNNIPNMIRYSWIPGLLVAGTPFLVAYLIRKFEYFEYQRLKKEQHMKRNHIRQLLQLIRIENEVLYELEQKLKEKIYKHAKNHTFDKDPDLYIKINEIFKDLSVLRKKREHRMDLLHLSTKILDQIIAILESKNMEKAVKEFPEYMSIKHELEYIEDNKDLDTTDKEEDLLEDIEEVSMPYMRTVTTHDKGLTALYNALVDLHNHYMHNHEDLKKKDSEIMQVERAFSDKVKAFSKKGTAL